MDVTPDLVALSLGAGVQSTTLALLAVEGTLPKPDVAIFADTGWEPRRVYEHLERIGNVLTDAGIELLKVSNGNLREDAINPTHRYASVPYFVLNPSFDVPITRPCPGPDGDGCAGPGIADADACPTCGGTGKVPTGETRPATREERAGMGRRQCTSEYKLDPITRKVRELLGASPPDFRRVPRGRTCEQWVGFSADEVGRMSNYNDRLYLRTVYPLIEKEYGLGWSRQDCRRYLEARGWTVEKSACIGCPYHGNRQWRQIRDTCRCGHPRDEHWRTSTACAHTFNPGAGDDVAADVCECPGFDDAEWVDAVEFDAAIRKGGARGLPLDGEAYLHRSMVPLAEAPIDRVTRSEWRERQGDLLEEIADLAYDRDEDGDPDGCSPHGCRSGEPVAVPE